MYFTFLLGRSCSGSPDCLWAVSFISFICFAVREQEYLGCQLSHYCLMLLDQVIVAVIAFATLAHPNINGVRF